MAVIRLRPRIIVAEMRLRPRTIVAGIRLQLLTMVEMPQLPQATVEAQQRPQTTVEAQQRPTMAEVGAALPRPPMEAAMTTTNQFLIAVARARGRLGKGGAPHLEAAASTVLSDWWAGRIRGGWAVASSGVGNAADGSNGKSNGESDNKGDEKKVVTEWAEEFKLDGLWI